MDDPLLYPRPKSRATAVEFANGGDHVSGEAGEKDSAAAREARSEVDSLSALANEMRMAYRNVQDGEDPYSYFRPESDATVVEPGSEGSTIEPIALEALREELKRTELTIKDSLAAASALRSEMHSLSALVTETRAEYRSVQETARGALERGATVEQRLGALESRLGPLADLEDVRRELEKRCDALNVLAQEVRANTRDVEVRRSLPSMRVAEMMANLRVPKIITRIEYMAVAVALLALVSALVLYSARRTVDVVGPPVVTPTAPVSSTAAPDLPNATSAATSSGGSLDSATREESLPNTRHAASVDLETSATERATEFVGTLSIRSTPDKAEVRVDRQRVGETPLILRRLRAGSHAIWIEHEGYQRWTKGLNVPAGEHTLVTATLQVEPGR